MFCIRHAVAGRYWGAPASSAPEPTRLLTPRPQPGRHRLVQADHTVLATQDLLDPHPPHPPRSPPPPVAERRYPRLDRRTGSLREETPPASSRNDDHAAGDDIARIRSGFLAEAVYRRPSAQMAAAQAAAAGTAWTYLFSGSPIDPELGAFHGADQFYLFDQLTQLGRATQANSI